MKQSWPAAERNKGPILEVLRRVLPAQGSVLEIASGTGQHAAYFAAELPQLEFLPSDLDEENLASIRAYVRDAGLPNLREPVRIDVLDAVWPVPRVAAAFCANMIHIAPWECCLGLVAGVAQKLVPGGVFVLYGPFRVGGAHTAESNAAFDASLRARDARWGVRDLELVQAEAGRCGLAFRERVAMPANNQCLVFDREADR